MNSIHVIQPYWHHGTWVFDDDEHGLSREPFVAGADTIVSKLAESLPNARSGFKLLFASLGFRERSWSHPHQVKGRKERHLLSRGAVPDGWMALPSAAALLS
jgi:hypothetical protein